MSRLDRLFLSFLAAVVAADIVVVNRGLRVSSCHRSFCERGEEAAAEVTGQEARPALREQASGER